MTEKKTGGVAGADGVGVVDVPPQEANAIPNKTEPTRTNDLRIA